MNNQNKQLFFTLRCKLFTLAKKDMQKTISKSKSNTRLNGGVGKGLLNARAEPEYKADNAKAIHIIKNGISQKQLLELKEQTGLDYENLSYIMGVTRQTITKKTKSSTYKVSEGDKIFRIAELYSYGYSVFENKDGFNRWMHTVNTALGNKKPIDFLDTMYGFQEVKNLIGRIDYGVYS